MWPAPGSINREPPTLISYLYDDDILLISLFWLVWSPTHLAPLHVFFNCCYAGRV